MYKLHDFLQKVIGPLGYLTLSLLFGFKNPDPKLFFTIFGEKIKISEENFIKIYARIEFPT